MHVISYPLLGLCIVSIFETIKYQYKDANRFPVLTVLWIYFYFLNVQNFKRGSSCEFAKFNIHFYDY